MGKQKIPHKATMHRGTLFDSSLEAEYYEHLIQQEDIANIKLQPVFILLEPFEIDCYRCSGSGRVPGKRKGTRKCLRCTGTGKKQRQEMKYTADFKVIYKDGREEVIDVKGGFKNEQFPLRKKLFEARYKQELIVVTKTKKGEWVRK